MTYLNSLLRSSIFFAAEVMYNVKEIESNLAKRKEQRAKRIKELNKQSDLRF